MKMSWTTAGVDGARRRVLAVSTVLVLGVGVLAPMVPASARQDERTQWVGTWSASPQGVDGFTTASPDAFANQTIRQVVRTSIGGGTLRIRFTNAFGTTPLVIGAAHVALQASGSTIVPASDRVLTFAGRGAVTVPPGASMASDAVALDVPPLSNVVVTIHLPAPTPNATFHTLARQTTWISPAGDFTAATTFPEGTTMKSWSFLAGLDVLASTRSGAVVALGDSITDGYASTVDANRRWPNLLAQRLRGAGLAHLAVLDQGISGNRLLHDGVGPNALSRLDRDVLAQPGVRWVTLLEGINDIGFAGEDASQAVTVDELVAAYRRIIARVHARGLRIYGATLTPFDDAGEPYFSADNEAKRQAVNRWIRTSGAFDAVIDFDRALRDPAHPTRLRPAYDSGDHLHPNDAGYRAMADAIDLRLFSRTPAPATRGSGARPRTPSSPTSSP